MAQIAKVELTREELSVVLSLVQGRLLEVERMVSGMEEGEGMDLQRHNALKAARPQIEMLTDLVMKLEGTRKDVR